MKMKDKLMLVISLLFLAFVILIFVNAMEIEEIQPVLVTNEAKSITFILGEDIDEKNNFYTNATSYYKYNPDARTDELITEARSLNEVISILNTRKVPVSELNLVVHSNPWSGISLPIDKNGERITAESLEAALQNGTANSVDTNVVNQKTVVHMLACGLGNNQRLVMALSNTFNGSVISASDGYMNFKSEDGMFTSSEMQVYYAFYPTAYKPADLHLARQLRESYPEVDKDWMNAMKNFSYKYNIPVEWEIQYPEYDVPALTTETDKLEWLMNQDELLDIIDRTEIPFDYFRWIVKKKGDSIKVYGKVTVLCVLEEMRV